MKALRGWRWLRLLLRLLFLAALWLLFNQLVCYPPPLHPSLHLGLLIVLISIPVTYTWWADRHTWPDDCCQFCGYHCRHNPSRICPECGMNRWTGLRSQTRCPRCGHDATGSKSATCAECGSPIG